MHQVLRLCIVIDLGARLTRLGIEADFFYQLVLKICSFDSNAKTMYTVYLYSIHCTWRFSEYCRLAICTQVNWNLQIKCQYYTNALNFISVTIVIWVDYVANQRIRNTLHPRVERYHANTILHKNIIFILNTTQYSDIVGTE